MERHFFQFNRQKERYIWIKKPQITGPWPQILEQIYPGQHLEAVLTPSEERQKEFLAKFLADLTAESRGPKAPSAPEARSLTGVSHTEMENFISDLVSVFQL